MPTSGNHASRLAGIRLGAVGSAIRGLHKAGQLLLDQLPVSVMRGYGTHR